MKITRKQLKQLIKEELLKESPWRPDLDGHGDYMVPDTTSATAEKAEALARSLQLPDQAITFIVSEFTRHEAEGSFDPSTGEGYGIDNEDGKIDFGQSWQDVWDELKDVLWDDADEDAVDEIYNKFFAID
jgi:hypothetical protein